MNRCSGRRLNGLGLAVALVENRGTTYAETPVIRTSQEEDTNTLAVISTNLRVDRKLSPKSAETIEEIVRAAYERFKGE